MLKLLDDAQSMPYGDVFSSFHGLNRDNDDDCDQCIQDLPLASQSAHQVYSPRF